MPRRARHCLLGQLRDRLEGLLAPAKIACAGIGQHDAVVEPHEELLAEKRLEIPHLLADGRRRDAELFGGRDIAARPRRRLKGAQGVERGQGSAFSSP